MYVKYKAWFIGIYCTTTLLLFFCDFRQNKYSLLFICFVNLLVFNTHLLQVLFCFFFFCLTDILMLAYLCEMQLCFPVFYSIWPVIVLLMSFLTRESNFCLCMWGFTFYNQRQLFCSI